MSSLVELGLASFSLMLTVLLTFLIFFVFKELNMGIFRGFFKLLIVAALISIVGRLLVLLQLDGRIGATPVGIDILTGTLFFILLTAAFARLVRDWRKISMEHPIGRGRK